MHSLRHLCLAVDEADPPESLMQVLKRQPWVPVNSVGLPQIGAPFSLAAMLEVGAAAARIRSSFRVSALSYIPPKLWDDQEADRYLVNSATRMVHLNDADLYWPKGASFDAATVNANLYNDLGLGAAFIHLFVDTWAMIEQGYNKAVDAASGFVADGLDLIPGVSCGDECRAQVGAAVRAGLVTVGLPPRLPNFGVLLKRGGKYFAHVMFDAVLETVLPDTPLDDQFRAEMLNAADSGVDAMVDELLCPNPGAPNCGYKEDDAWTWGVPDPYYRARPAVLWVHLSRDKLPMPPAERLRVAVRTKEQPGGETSWPYPYGQRAVPLPTSRGFEVDVPIVLWPGFPGSVAYEAEGSQLVDILEPHFLRAEFQAWAMEWLGPVYRYIFTPDDDLRDPQHPSEQPDLKLGQPVYTADRRCQVEIVTEHRIIRSDTKEEIELRLGWEAPEIRVGGVWDAEHADPRDGYFGALAYKLAPLF